MSVGSAIAGGFALFCLGSAAAAEENLVPNPSVETPDPDNPDKPHGWDSNQWGDLDTAFIYTQPGHLSERALRLELYSGTEGDAKWWPQPFPVVGQGGAQVALFYQADVESEMLVQALGQDDESQWLWVGAFPPADTWTRAEGTVEFPPWTTQARLMQILSTPGWLETDDYEMVQDGTPVDPDPPAGAVFVSVAFDDGWVSAYEHAVPIMNARGLRGTHFIHSDWVDKPGYQADHMTSPQLAELAGAGHEIGSHALYHDDLTALSDDDLHHHLSQSKETLEDLGLQVVGFAPPGGDYDARVIDEAGKYYDYLRSIKPGLNRKPYDLFNLKCRVVVDSMTVDQLQEWVDQAAESGDWLVLLYHRFGPEVSADTIVTPARFEEWMDYLVQIDAVVRPMGEHLGVWTPEGEGPGEEGEEGMSLPRPVFDVSQQAGSNGDSTSGSGGGCTLGRPAGWPALLPLLLLLALLGFRHPMAGGRARRRVLIAISAALLVWAPGCSSSSGPESSSAQETRGGDAVVSGDATDAARGADLGPGPHPGTKDGAEFDTTLPEVSDGGPDQTLPPDGSDAGLPEVSEVAGDASSDVPDQTSEEMPQVCAPTEFAEVEPGICDQCNPAGTGYSGQGQPVSDDNECTDDVCDPVEGVVHSPHQGPCDDGDPLTGLDGCVEGLCQGQFFCPPGEFLSDGGQCLQCSGSPEGTWVYGQFVEPAADWTWAGTQVELPEGTTQVRYMHLLAQDGWLETDGYQLEAQGWGNLVPNPSVEEVAPGQDGLPQGWEANSWGEATFSFDYLEEGQEGERSLRVQVDDWVSGDGKWWSRPFPVPGPGTVQVGNFYRASAGSDQLLLALSGGTELVEPGTPMDDGNPCTDDVCDPVQGVQHYPASKVCDDGDPGTIDDYCIEGECTGQPAFCLPDKWVAVSQWWCAQCNEFGTDYVGEGEAIEYFQCTDDLCDPDLGVVHLPIPGPCWDEDICTTADACVDGQCAGTPWNCDDGSDCTNDSCTDGSGCAFEMTDGPCSDGLPFTTDDTCIQGTCVGLLDPDQDAIANYGDGPPCKGPAPPADCVDNCPYHSNPDQLDTDSDGLGDACETPSWWLRVETQEMVIALTFDDGWSDWAFASILETLKSRQAKATFFINGSYVEDGTITKDYLHMAANFGHLLGNHSFNHSTGTSVEECVVEILLNEDFYVDQGLGSLRPLYRMPAPDPENPQLWVYFALAQTGFTESVLASLDPQDWVDPEPPVQEMVECITETAAPGDVVGFHVGPTVTALALPQVLDNLTAKGFQFVTLQELLKYGQPEYVLDISQADKFKTCEDYYQE